MTEPDLAVRRTVAREHGLPVNAIQFLTGETVAEVEQSAARLVDVLRERDEQHERAEQLRAPSGFFERARIEKAERQEALMSALCGRAQQPRTEQGRFAAADDRQAAAGFDGGTRTPVTKPVTHESWLSDALRTGAADVGADLET